MQGKQLPAGWLDGAAGAQDGRWAGLGPGEREEEEGVRETSQEVPRRRREGLHGRPGARLQQ